MTQERSSSQVATAIRASHLGLTFSGGHEVLANLNLTLQHGEFVSIVGPSGCGKSTILRLMAGLITPTTGLLERNHIATESQKSHRTGFVFQDPRLLEWRNVRDNIRLPMELAGIPRAEQERDVDASLKLIGLSAADETKLPRMLSGGMRMRVSLARSLVMKPDLLLLDEPFAALDELLREQLNEDILRIWEQRRWTGVFVTHNVSEAIFLSQRVIIMRGIPGRIVHVADIPFQYPRERRLRAEPRFAKIVGEVMDHLRGGDR